MEAKRLSYSGALDIKLANGNKGSFSEAFKQYDIPYAYLRELLKIDSVARADVYRFFIKISYRILNRHGAEVSGGERSEFRLLQHHPAPKFPRRRRWRRPEFHIQRCQMLEFEHSSRPTPRHRTCGRPLKRDGAEYGN